MKYSVRTLLIGVAIVSVVAAFAVRFGPHAYWVAVRPSGRVRSIPSQPLTEMTTSEEFRSCRLGPYRFEAPAAMCDKIDIQRGAGTNVRLSDGQRSLLIPLTPLAGGLFENSTPPDQSKLSHARLYKEILAADSEDFSFGMSRRDLRWHKWLIEQRAVVPELMSSEFLFQPDVEGNLLQFSPAAQSYDWCTTDGAWSGALRFSGRPQDNAWIRRVCRTFTVKGDAGRLAKATDAEIKSEIEFSD